MRAESMIMAPNPGPMLSRSRSFQPRKKRLSRRAVDVLGCALGLAVFAAFLTGIVIVAKPGAMSYPDPGDDAAAFFYGGE